MYACLNPRKHAPSVLGSRDGDKRRRPSPSSLVTIEGNERQGAWLQTSGDKPPVLPLLSCRFWPSVAHRKPGVSATACEHSRTGVISRWGRVPANPKERRHSGCNSHFDPRIFCAKEGETAAAAAATLATHTHTLPPSSRASSGD